MGQMGTCSFCPILVALGGDALALARDIIPVRYNGCNTYDVKELIHG